MNINKVNEIRNSIGDNTTLVAVTKNQSIEDVQVLYDNGYRQFGENKLQELVKKKQIFPDATWHFIGRIQSNKLKAIVANSALIHSVSEYRYLQKINSEAQKIDKVQDVLLQLNIANEPTKKGLTQGDLDAIINEDSFSNVNIRGIMVMGDHVDDEATIINTFRVAKETFETLKSDFDSFDTLSMGMSSDYMLAVQNGSTMVRLGTILFTD
ncbi:YggS family pyridoxal phosphate-dependent enzyme [Mollicutes bacterium LVI A0078]|nr:YggS family pyridoxal phosphate-dependent enzyme [Mollicutes bacterium LVI A0075]WOO90736.1 YggS family pyridoxal phosphate-dependent enzyme [Mollicutes bacterium LVI A0078]